VPLTAVSLLKTHTDFWNRRARCAKVWLPIITLLMLASSVFAEDATGSRRAVHSLIVSVFDTRGIAIRDLTKQNFHVRLNGKPVVVLNARYSTTPRRFVVLLDMSRSMIDDDAKWNSAREAVSNLLTQIPKAVPIAMLTFTQDVRDEFNSSQNREAISEWLNGPGRHPTLKSPAKTALFDAVVDGLNLLGGLQPGDLIYAITDGLDSASRKSEEQTKAALAQSQVRLFAFILAQPLERPTEPDLEKRDFFVSLVSESGGSWVGSTSHGNHLDPRDTINYLFKDKCREKVRGWTEWLNLQVNGGWTLDFATPPQDKKRDIKVEIISQEGKIRKDVRLTYPRLLPPQR
jgi:hypothetical protein